MLYLDELLPSDLLYDPFKPPLGTHHRHSGDYFGMQYTKSPVLQKNIHTHFTLLADHSITLLVGLMLYTWILPYLPREEYRRLVQRYPEGRHHHQLKQQPQQQGHHADQQNCHQNTLRCLKIDIY